MLSPLSFNFDNLPKYLSALMPPDFTLSTRNSSHQIHFILIYTISPVIRRNFQLNKEERSFMIDIDDENDYLLAFIQLLYKYINTIEEKHFMFFESIIKALEITDMKVFYDFKPPPLSDLENYDIFEFLTNYFSFNPVEVIVNESPSHAASTVVKLTSSIFSGGGWVSKIDNCITFVFNSCQVQINSYTIVHVFGKNKERRPKMLTFEGSNDGYNWFSIDEIYLAPSQRDADKFTVNIESSLYASYLRVTQLCNWEQSEYFGFKSLQLTGHVRFMTRHPISFEQYMYLISDQKKEE